MFSASARPETITAPYSPFDRRLSYSGEQQQPQQYYGPPARPQYEPPRPLEPRPTLYTSLSDTTSLHRPRDSYQPVSGVSEQRLPAPSLPGLRDILTPGPATTGGSSLASAWHTPTSAHAQTRPHYAPPYAHQPPAVEPHAKAPHERRTDSWEVPIHTSAPGTAHAVQAAPLTPYASYGSEYMAPQGNYHERTLPNSNGAHLASGLSSPYVGPQHDARPYSTGPPGYEQAQTPSASGADNQRKYLGIKEIPGEGTFHFYEGGYRIPTHVDGEHVNPAWGLTKANKPRKRLALACLDCREKKIKCEPGATSCLQCEKAKRPCRRTQTQQTPTETGSTDWSPSASSHSRNNASVSDPNPVPAPPREGESDIVNKRRSREEPSPPNVPQKKHRSASPLPASIRDGPMTAMDSALEDGTSKTFVNASNGNIMSWEDDPFDVDPHVTLHLIHVYFEHFNSATYCLYPRRHFMQWLECRRDKCQNERMVLYAILAVGSIFGDESLAGFGRQCARLALDVLPLQVGKMQLCTAQTRTLLALYSFAKGDHGAAWEHSGAAIRAVQHLAYNTEIGCLQDSALAEVPRREFNFSAMQLVESRRRTFWAAFFMDRYSLGAVTVLKPQDIFLRLPCAEEAYESGLSSDAPYLNNGIVDPIKSLLTADSPIAPMGWHVMVAAIWGDVIDFVFRGPHHAAVSYRDMYESFYSDILGRLQGWASRLPADLQYSVGNLGKSIQRGYGSTFVSIHALYHLCAMKLNRCLRHSLAQDSIARNIRAAHDHGHQVLHLMSSVNAAMGDIDLHAQRQTRGFILSTPFPGYAALAAVDIVSAGGTDSALGSTLEEINSATVCLQRLALFWHSAKDQARLCQKRYYQLQNILKNPSRARGGAWLGRKWGLEKPIEANLSADDDCIYGLGGTTEATEIYFDAFRDPAQSRASSGGGLRLV